MFTLFRKVMVKTRVPPAYHSLFTQFDEIIRDKILGYLDCFDLQSFTGVLPEKHCINVRDSASRGHLSCLKKYLRYKRYYRDDWIPYAAENGHMSLLMHGVSLNYPRDPPSAHRAAKGGHLDCLRYLHENGWKIDQDVCIGAAKSGSLECLIYAHERSEDHMGGDIVLEAAWNGHIDCLRYAIENRCADMPCNGHSIPVCEMKDICSHTARKGHYECLAYLHQNGFELTSSCLSEAARNGHLDCLKYAHENGIKLDTYRRVLGDAILSGNKECIDYLLINDAPINELTYDCVIKTGNLECLQRLYEKEGGAVLTTWQREKLEIAASENGHLNCLEYVHWVILNGIINTEVFVQAIINDHVDCAEYFFKRSGWNQMHIKNAVMARVARNGSLNSLKYLHEDLGISMASVHCAHAKTQECFEYLYNNGASRSELKHKPKLNRRLNARIAALRKDKEDEEEEDVNPSIDEIYIGPKGGKYRIRDGKKRYLKG
jgi:hypothetical protein